MRNRRLGRRPTNHQKCGENRFNLPGDSFSFISVVSILIDRVGALRAYAARSMPRVH